MKYEREKFRAALALSRESRELNGKAEEWLRHKCNWEHMTRTGVILEWPGEVEKLLVKDRRTSK